MEVGASEGYQFDLQAMFDRLKFPARGRRGGYNGAKTTIALDDGTALKGKGKQSIPYRSTVKMAFPGGAGYGDPLKRDLDQVRLDLQKGYIQIIHGTTLATNSLIERKGAKTALITTEGFRDVIEMRTESRFEQYDLNLSLPDPLLSREHRYVLKERIDAQLSVLLFNL